MKTFSAGLRSRLWGISNKARDSLGRAEPTITDFIEERNFLQRYGHLAIGQMVSDWQEVALEPQDNDWVGLPPERFIEFCRTYPKTPFDGIPPSQNYLKPPSFLLAQAHRIWLTSSLVHQRLGHLSAKSFLDLGSFPFFVSLVVRDYFGFEGEITVTTNYDLPEAGWSFLHSKDIKVELLDLDPYVRDPNDSRKSLPVALDVPDGSFDLVLSSNVIEHLYHPKTMIDQCHRVLRENGEFVVTTDNAMKLEVFNNYITGVGFIFDPVENTAAMHFDCWRGHVRFFTEKDLKTLLERSGFAVSQVEYFHCFYEVLFDEYFKHPAPKLGAWKKRMLTETPWLRNDVAIIARKP